MEWVFIGIVYCELSLLYFGLTGMCGHHYFNPLVNYKEWYRFNIFGVLIFTLFINILLAPWAIIYWVFKILVFMFTVGRR